MVLYPLSNDTVPTNDDTVILSDTTYKVEIMFEAAWNLSCAVIACVIVRVIQSSCFELHYSVQFFSGSQVSTTHIWIAQ